MADELRVELRKIEPGDKLTGLSLGDSSFTPLKIFLQKHAKVFHDHDLAKTYGIFLLGEKPKVIAYITLVCGEIVTEDGVNLLGDDTPYAYNAYPAVKIARLAVDQRYRGWGLGTQLVDFSLGTVKDLVCPAVGCRFVVVDSKRSAVRFYRRHGFTLLNTPANRARDEPILFIDLKKTHPS